MPGTYGIIILLLAKNQVELGVLVIGLFTLRSECDHHSVLQEIIVVGWVGVETLVFQVMDPTDEVSETMYMLTPQMPAYSFSLISTWKQMMSPSWISL